MLLNFDLFIESPKSQKCTIHYIDFIYNYYRFTVGLEIKLTF